MKTSTISYDPKSDREFKRLLDRANAYWDEKSLEKALEEYLNLLKMALILQNKYGRFHKGEYYYNTGKLQFEIFNLSDSIKYIIASHVEDILIGDDKTPAYDFLVDTFKVELSFVNELKSYISNIRKTQVINNPLDCTSHYLTKMKIQNPRQLIKANLRPTRIIPLLNERILQGETQDTEFKKSLSLISEGLEALCAMVNTDDGCGMVIFGVEPDKTICGVESVDLDTVQQTINQKANRFIKPNLMLSIRLAALNDKTVIVIEAKRDKKIPYYEYKGFVYLRQGSQKRKLINNERQQLIRERNHN